MESIDLGPEPSVSEPPKRRVLLYVVILAVIAIAVVVCAIYVTDGDDRLRTDLKVGDYIEYEHIEYHGDVEVGRFIARYDIVSVKGDQYYIRDTTDGRITYEYRNASLFLDFIRFRDSEMDMYNFEGVCMVDTFKGELELKKYTHSYGGARIVFYADSDNVLYDYFAVGHERVILKGTSLL